MAERYPLIVLSSSSPTFNMTSGQIFNFVLDDNLNEAEIFINGYKLVVKRASVSSLRVSGNNSSVIDFLTDVHDDFFTSALRYQVLFQGHDEKFYFSDNLWSVGRYEIEPSAPVLESSAATSSLWNFIKP